MLWGFGFRGLGLVIGGLKYRGFGLLKVKSFGICE